MIDTNMEREDLIQKMKTRSETKSKMGLPGLSPHLKCLSTSCLQKRKKYLLNELEPIDICDFLFEEKAIEIMTHDKITEKEKRQQQVEDLLQTLQENENDCFHYFLYIIEKNKFNGIRNVLESRFKSEDVRDDDPKDDHMELRIIFKGLNAEQIERDLFQQLGSSAPGLWQLIMANGQMNIEKVSRGSLVLQLRPLTDQAVKTLLNAKENNKLVDMIFGMLKNIKIADKIDGTKPLKIMEQVCYASQAQENTVHGNPEAKNVEQIKSRLKAYREKLISDVEPRALASVLSKHFPKIDFNSVDYADSCPRRVERLLSLVEEGEPDLVKEFSH